MITLQSENLHKIGKLHGISSKEIKPLEKLLPKFLDKIKSQNLGFYKVIDDKKLVKSIQTFAKKVKGHFDNIIVLGIGGSALGTTLLKQSFTHLFGKKSAKNPEPNLYVIDNLDPTLISQLEEILDFKKTLFIVVSKSGETLETLVQYYYFRKKVEDKKLKPHDHFVFVTDAKKGPLREIAEKEKLETFEVPENVGGRFSVLTAVSLLPAALIGINIEKLLDGAKTFRSKFLSKNTKGNLCFEFALYQYELYRKGINMAVLMPYSQKLITLSDWYRQLLAESIGKKFTRAKKRVNVGITPISALGTTDQHSQIQLYNEGPNNKLIIFVEVKKLEPKLILPKFFGKKVVINKIFELEKTGTEDSLTENNRPNITIKIDEINEKTLGELILFFEGSIAFLGEFFNINAYDQPGVELSKKITKKLLAKTYGLSLDSKARKSAK